MADLWKEVRKTTTVAQEMIIYLATVMQNHGVLPQTIFRWLSTQAGRNAMIKAFEGLYQDFLHDTKLINCLGTTTTSATTEQFVARNKFRTDSKEVKFYEIWDSFEKWFLTGDSKIEPPMSGRELRYGDLMKNATDLPKKEGGPAIIPELGGEAKAETTLTELYDLLKKQANGEKGVLLTNGRANIFYIKDASGVLRAVNAPWYGDGWHVYAGSVGDPSGWSAGSRVFSRNS